ncbi:MAG: helix-turn-helix transcriptional regulator [Bacteroides sp.]|nr:helix-turn-helix transcriptional regulator [Bacteroides sp.]
MKLNRIKVVLSEKGISQTWLAKKLDKSFSMVNAYACNRIPAQGGCGGFFRSCFLR